MSPRAQKITPETIDPLANLRGADTPEPPPAEPVVEETVEVDLGGVVYDQAWHDDAVRDTVQVWHADALAQKFAHRGGTCTCAYLAALCLTSTLGVALPEYVEGDGEKVAEGTGTPTGDGEGAGEPS